MGNLVMNIAKGRVAEMYNRVDLGDPAASALYVIAWVATATDATIIDLDDVAAIEADVNTAEATNTGYARKELVETDIVAFAPDDVNDRVDLDIPDQTWTAVAAGSNWTDLCIAYDADTGLGVDSDKTPLTWHDFSVTPDGCLSAETIVLLNDHPKPIVEVETGDVVYNLHPDGLVSLHNVEAKKYSGEQETFMLSASNGREIIATANHPFLALGHGKALEWKPLYSLKESDWVACATEMPKGFGLAKVTGIHPAGVRDTWDIEIHDSHQFVANGFIVHNSDITAQIAAAGFYRAS